MGGWVTKTKVSRWAARPSGCFVWASCFPETLWPVIVLSQWENFPYPYRRTHRKRKIKGSLPKLKWLEEALTVQTSRSLGMREKYVTPETEPWDCHYIPVLWCIFMPHENARNYGHHRIFTVVSCQKNKNKTNLTNVKNIVAKRLKVVVVVTMEEEEKEMLIQISVPPGLTSI